MGRRGPQPAAQAELLFWEGEWLKFFVGIRDGFPSVEFKELSWSLPTTLTTNPVLLEELKRSQRQRPQTERPSRIRKTRSVLPERILWEKLVKATTVRQVRRVCKTSRYWNDAKIKRKPQPYGGMFLARLGELYKKADQFLAAKMDSHYPASLKRPSSDQRRVGFLARAMAGVTVGKSPSTGSDRLSRGRQTGSGAV